MSHNQRNTCHRIREIHVSQFVLQNQRNACLTIREIHKSVWLGGLMPFPTEQDHPAWMQWSSDDPDNLICLDNLIWTNLIIVMILIIRIIDNQDN